MWDKYEVEWVENEIGGSGVSSEGVVCVAACCAVVIGREGGWGVYGWAGGGGGVVLHVELCSRRVCWDVD